MGHSKGIPEREVYSDTDLPIKNRNSSNKQPNHTPRRHKCFKYITTNIGASKYIEKILLAFKKDIDINTIIVGAVNTPLSKLHRSFKQNINKDIVALNNALDEMDLTDREPFIPN